MSVISTAITTDSRSGADHPPNTVVATAPKASTSA